jgi:hypothetical protein
VKNIILSTVLFSSLMCNAVENNYCRLTVSQTNAFSDALNTAGALTCAAIYPLLGGVALSMGYYSMLTAVNGNPGEALASLCCFWVLGFWAEQVLRTQKLCTDCTSAQLKPLSEVLQVATGVSSLVGICFICSEMAKIIAKETQKA